MEREISHDFNVVSRACRIHSGLGALDRIGDELKRAGVSRALLLTGRSLAEGTGQVARIESATEGRVAGVFARVRKDTPIEDVEAAAALARELGADGLIALGGGSVVQAARITAILLAEDGTPEALATQYPEDGPAVSPRLMAPKLPILNALTIGTTAQDRGGSPARGQTRRLEFFDPKTRPAALFWDREALATAPISMLKATAAMTWWRAVLDMGWVRATPLADLNRREVLEIAERIRRALAAGDDGDAVRADLCLATWLMNRAADDGARPVNTWASRVNYEFSTELFHRHGEVAQGAAVAALGPAVLRETGARDPAAMQGIAAALGLQPRWDGALPALLADRVRADLGALGMATDLSALGIPKDSAGPMLERALKNFNADPTREFAREKDWLAEVLDACW